ncbi:putative 28S ribosomal protein S26, mitochondrial [Cryptotermes secundus]|uniref:Small ribosomal subunit protein mS26 n=2 Tax=Cryptotermes secundus TaxID=105785 RepID=A0A2J7RH80_9NEOP|nr:putative 28S ribosomal protein S26, mitochondrial [Cryptotermes secundus]
MNTLGCSLKYSGLHALNELRIKPVCVQSVRWKRKPRWLPVAKSKQFRVPERPKFDEGETLELRRLYDRYRTHLRAVRKYLKQEFIDLSASSSAALEGTQNEAEEHQLCLKENEEWNKQVALLREQRLLQEQEARRESILAKLVAAEERQKERMEKAEEMVREEKERAKFYITADNIDKAIEDALASPVDHNYAIDLEGHIYRGHKTKPSDVPPDELEKIQVQG